ncbi:MAG: glucuronate isomerase [Firmicutes bacterium]|nr:glucuronate isomerase [Bacillota bacterium]
MKSFLDENFLLKSKQAEQLYHDYAKDRPIYDYHNHLEANDIAIDRSYGDLSEVWLQGDHYKWRIMRAMGHDERFISGSGDPKEKLRGYTEAVSQAVGNPLYHWSHMELKGYFGIEERICPENVDKIWEQANSYLKSLSTIKMLTLINVHTLCTTNDILENLDSHKKVMDAQASVVTVRPSFRPDKVVRINKHGFVDYIHRLVDATQIVIRDFGDLKKAIKERLNFFDDMGCLCADHGLDVFNFVLCDEAEANVAFKRVFQEEILSAGDAAKYQSALLRYLAQEYRSRGWVMQLHIGALRDNNQPMYRRLGPDSGFDAVNDAPVAQPLSQFLNAAMEDGGLPKTILYCLNPKDNYILSTIGGCFWGDGIKGRVQFGPAWWFVDHLEGMEKQLTDLATTGVLGTFVGMLTDSRSFLSFVRHEYFRRILCNFIAEKVVNGELPWDEKWLGDMVKRISFDNARTFFEG